MTGRGTGRTARGPRERLVDATGAVVLVVAGMVGGATDSEAPVLPGLIGVVGVILAVSSWNDIGVGCRVDGESLVGTTITGVRRVEVTRATRIHAYRVRGRWQLRVAGPDGAIAVPASVPLVPQLVRAAILDRPSQMAVTRRAAGFLDLPPDLPTRTIPGGRFGAMLSGAFGLFLAGGLLGAALLSRA